MVGYVGPTIEYPKMILHISQMTVAAQIELAVKAYHDGHVQPFTGNYHVDKTLTDWSMYTDEYTDQQLPTVQGVLYRLHETCTRTDLETFLKGVDWKDFFDSVKRSRKITLPPVHTWLDDLSKRSKWELIYLILEVENIGTDHVQNGFWSMIPLPAGTSAIL
jgi:hypothetical protein